MITSLKDSSYKWANKRNHTMYVTLSMPCDTEILSDIQCYVCGNFLEVSTATESDVASGHSKIAQKFYSGNVE